MLCLGHSELTHEPCNNHKALSSQSVSFHCTAGYILKSIKHFILQQKSPHQVSLSGLDYFLGQIRLRYDPKPDLAQEIKYRYRQGVPVLGVLQRHQPYVRPLACT